MTMFYLCKGSVSVLLWRLSSQVRDEEFNKEEKLFRSLEKAVRQLVKNITCYLLYTQV